MKNNVEYLFVFDEESKGWWLKIDTAEKLLDYLQQSANKRLSGGFELYWELYKRENTKEKGQHKSIREILEEMTMQERFELMTKRRNDFNMMLGAIMQAEKYGGTIFDGFRNMNIETGYKELEDIRRYGQTYLNAAGGSTFYVEYTQFCRKNKLIFPNFTEKDIRIEQFKGGTHYYAYIGNMEVKNGDTLRFHSYEEAHNRAAALLNG